MQKPIHSGGTSKNVPVVLKEKRYRSFLYNRCTITYVQFRKKVDLGTILVNK